MWEGVLVSFLLSSGFFMCISIIVLVFLPLRTGGGMRLNSFRNLIFVCLIELIVYSSNAYAELASLSVFGGASYDEAKVALVNGFAGDGQGQVYVLGDTSSDGFTGVQGGFNSKRVGPTFDTNGNAVDNPDIFVSQFDKSAATVLQSTYEGFSQNNTNYGALHDFILSSVINPNTGEVMVLRGNNLWYPTVTVYSHDLKHVTRSFEVDPDYTKGYTLINDLAFDPDTNTLYLVGKTKDTSFPMVANGVQPKFTTSMYDTLGTSVPPGTDPNLVAATAVSAQFDGIVLKLSVPSDSGQKITLVQSTYLGGSEFDEARTVYFDRKSKYLFIGGETRSLDLTGAVNSAPAKNDGLNPISKVRCGFVAKIDADLKNSLSTVYFSGSGEEVVEDILVNDGKIYITGQTTSVDLLQPGKAAAVSAKPSNGGYYVAYFSTDLKLNTVTYVNAGRAQQASSISERMGSSLLDVRPETGEIFTIATGTWQPLAVAKFQ